MRASAARRRLLAIATDRGLSKRRACRLLGLSRAVAQYRLRQPAKDRPALDALLATSQRFPRFGYRPCGGVARHGRDARATPVAPARATAAEAAAAATALRLGHPPAGSGGTEHRLDV